MTPASEQPGESPDSLAPSTLAITLGRPHSPDAPLNTPIVPATSFLAGSGPGYSRASNPSWESFEEIVGGLEGGTAYVVGSGMAAIDIGLSVLLARAATDGRMPVIAAPRVHYAGSWALIGDLVRAGAATLLTYSGEDHEGALAAAAAADVVLVETPANPTMQITDIAAVAAATNGGVLCDNTYATPLATRPLDLGVDIVIHSASKYLAGHSDALLGVAVARDPAVAEAIFMQRTVRGATAGVLEAWLGTRGARTLALRVGAATASAGEIARRLAGRADVIEVRYPGLPSDPGHEVAARQMRGFGAIITFRPAGGAERAEEITRSTRLWLHATSLGGVESTLERRRRHDMENTEVPADLVRLSVGCEDVEDLWRDLAAALDATAPSL